MIELLGIGVHRWGVWQLRQVCACFESRTFATVLSSRRECSNC